MNAICYVMGWRLFGKWFIFCSAVASTSFSVTYGICEQFPPLWPQIAQHPLIASLVGACFVGIGAGLCVRVGGAAGGDDALAMSLSHLTHWKIQTVYLLTDFVVLVLSLSYIPFQRIIYSILTVLLSGQIIGSSSGCRCRCLPCWIQQRTNVRTVLTRTESVRVHQGHLFVNSAFRLYFLVTVHLYVLVDRFHSCTKI